MVVGKSAKFKKIPKTIVLELKSRALLQIAGQEREHDVRLRLQALKYLLNSGKDPPPCSGKAEWKTINVFAGERSDVFFRWVDLIFTQDIANNCAIGFSRDFDVAQIIFGAKSVAHCHFERFHACPAGIHQRSVNVEKKKTHCRHGKMTNDE